ncbi:MULTISPECIES: hypothetical protein [Mycobacteroides]|uniref:Uncharacterized protein n=1 Tax=Mycobacteroides immunogenum TaxID=83262 RepID=A0A7V8LP93_9MYCO|nr:MULTISPECIES: hypothetical protein [Mycobacteroides]AMT69261.1 hypothetical protein ABG82_01710 [Mycobacteroides immunogenum]ANO02293.1 hypothetical protein BAB75_01705 [Mycobacteroides immunogenum]KIU38251.1 hypothetical protein TL11_23275 [Mycobacteroides immunogenum]KPG11221.1 hypothetical protein AN908_12560 [Mycobacteroides immunogenum]KPG12559.1 hypothetical protein AN909_07095 [Mycobacteroides immunogenum]
MNDPDLWSVVSKMLAVLTIGHTAMMLLSKVVGLSESRWTKFGGKLIECVALLSLLCTSALFVQTFTESANNLPPNALTAPFAVNTIAQALVTYFLLVVICSTCAAFIYIGLALARNNWVEGLLGGFGKAIEVFGGWFITTLGLVPFSLAGLLLVNLANPSGQRTQFYIAVFSALMLAAVLVAAQGLYRERGSLIAFCKAVLAPIGTNSPD